VEEKPVLTQMDPNVAALSEEDAKRLLSALLRPEQLFAENEKGQTPLARAIDQGDDDLAILMAKKAPKLLMVANERNQWPLEQAAMAGRRGLCEGLLGVFLDNQATALKDVNAQNRRFAPVLALNAAINEGHVDVVALFLPFWTDPVGTRRWPTDDPATPIPVKSRPLGLACEARQWEAFAYILDHSSAEEINHCDVDGLHKGDSIGHSLLSKIEVHSSHPAEREGHMNALGALARRPDWVADALATLEQIEAGAHKRSVMMAAIEAENIDVVRLLIPRVEVDALRAVEAEPQKRNGRESVEKHTLLSFAIHIENKAIVEALLPHAKTSLTAKNVEWAGSAQSVLELARENYSWEIAVVVARELLNRGLMPKEEQQALEEQLAGFKSVLPDSALDYKGQFSAAREAAEIRAVVQEDRLATDTVSNNMALASAATSRTPKRI